MRNRRLEVRPLSPAIGAELFGADLAAELDDETIGEIRDALLEHCVVFFREQRLTEAQHKAFARRFGEPTRHPMIRPDAEHPEILKIVKQPGDANNFGGDWHSDLTYTPEPALGSVLYAREVPEYGGDTLFANTQLAYEALSDGMKRLLDGLSAVHSTDLSYGDEGKSGLVGEKESMPVAQAAYRPQTAEHPVVRTHPETGRKGLYVNRIFTTRFVGMTKAESAPLLEFLFRHVERPEFTCRFRWRAGSLAFWDNRSAQHYALNDYHGQRREMHRITIAGDRPV
jgi:taurine dioxygenase